MINDIAYKSKREIKRAAFREAREDGCDRSKAAKIANAMASGASREFGGFIPPLFIDDEDLN